MATVTYPGVYIEEVSSGVRPITAASTSTAAFIGEAERGPIGTPVRVFNFTEFQTHFGGFMSSSYLAHAVYQFFNNGGSICYALRVASNDAATAAITLADQHGTPNETLTVATVSPGRWGNAIDLIVSPGTLNPANEFNLEILFQGASVETFENLGMIPGTANFAETASSTSAYVRLTTLANAHVTNGTSTGSAAPTVPLSTPRTRMRVNIDGDGLREINLLDAVANGDVADLANANNVATAIQALLRALPPQRASTAAAAYTAFACTVAVGGELVLTSGTASASSSVNVAVAQNAANDCSGLLALGSHNGGSEQVGSAVTRPQFNGQGGAPALYHLGDHDVSAAVPGVSSTTPPVLGSNGTPVASDLPYINALTALDNLDDVSLIAVPGIGSANVVSAGMNYCENRSLSDCFFIGDMAQDVDTVNEAQTFAAALSPKNSYGAVYIPWMLMLDPTGVSNQSVAVPPSGFMAGLYAKTDARRGVWKAPAGTESGLAGATGLVVNFTDIQQGLLNPAPHNINVIRQFAASGRVIWGARTVHSDAEWRYVPVRRLVIMLRVSIYRGIQWAVFEPNDEELWSQLKLNIGAFMMTLFRQGAFQGSTPNAAFFVKCDAETTTQNDINNGIVNVLVGFAPLKPAEFVVVKISQKAGQTS